MSGIKHPDHLLFLHIPKAAGITMLGVLFRNYARKDRFGTKGMWQGNADFNALSPAQQSQIKLLYGHFPFGFHEQLGAGTSEYFTMLRDPIERVLSAYSDILETKDHYLHKQFSTTKPKFADLHKSGSWPGMDNCQIHILSNNIIAPYGSIGQEQLDQAIKNLETFFPVAGVQLYFDECLTELRERYGWKTPYYRKRHVTGKRIRQQDLKPEELEIIRSANIYDQLLFDYVWRKCEERYEKSGKAFRQQVDRFQMRNQLLGRMISVFSPVRKD